MSLLLRWRFAEHLDGFHGGGVPVLDAELFKCAREVNFYRVFSATENDSDVGKVTDVGL